MAKKYLTISKTEDISESFPTYDSLKNVSEYINGLIKKYGEDATFDCTADISWECPILCVEVNYRRPETDEERDDRLAKARKERAKKQKNLSKQQQKERHDLAKLLKKYDGSVDAIVEEFKDIV